MKIEVYEKIIGTEGFWRVAQDRNGVWWFLTPDNKKEFLNLVGGVNPSQLAHNTGGPHYVGKNSEDIESWADEKVKQVKEYGFKGIDAWSDKSLYDRDIPIAKDLNLWKSIPHDISSSLWELEILYNSQQQIDPVKNNKNLIGYYLDNELEWSEDSPEARKICKKYFDLTHFAIRTLDKNHLILGVRFKKLPPDYVLQICKDYVDVNSINYYNTDLSELIAACDRIYEITGKPIINSEYSYFCDKNTSGNKNANWNHGGEVASQYYRGWFYKYNTSGMAKRKYLVGCSWFQWNDEPPTGRKIDLEDCNFGVVDIHDNPYEELINYIEYTGKRLNVIHETIR